MALWEYNAYMEGAGLREKMDTAHCILAGYYSAYYANGGKRAKSPDELIRQLFRPRQSREQGVAAIERAKRLDARLAQGQVPRTE